MDVFKRLGSSKHISAIAILFLLYAVWQIYWYQKVGLEIIKWHAHLALYGFIWLAGFCVLKLLYKANRSKSVNNVLLLFSSVVLVLFLAELALVVSGKTKTSFEEMTGYYHSPSVPFDTGYYHVWQTRKEHVIKKQEYTYSRPTNSLGLPDVEWPVKKEPGEKRILSLGDSFTEGDGAPDDSDYVALLKKKLDAKSSGYYLMNAGVLASDPFFNFIQLKDQLLPYKPDYILQTLSSQDITSDITVRGGMERFQKNGTLKFNAAPWWEPLYAVSYISRFFFKWCGYNELLKKEEITDAQKTELNKKTGDLLKQYSALCRQNGIRLFVVLRPDKYEIVQNKYQYDIESIVKESGVEKIDLLPLYKAYTLQNKTAPEDYFWPIDGHHNSKGYQMMADVVYESIGPVLTDSLQVAPGAEAIKN